MKNFLFYIVSFVSAITLSHKAYSEYNPIALDQFKKQIEVFNNYSSVYDLKQFETEVKDYILELTEKKEIALLNTATDNLKNYKQIMIFNKEKITSSLQYRISHRLLNLMGENIPQCTGAYGILISASALMLQLLSWNELSGFKSQPIFNCPKGKFFGGFYSSYTIDRTTHYHYHVPNCRMPQQPGNCIIYSVKVNHKPNNLLMKGLGVGLALISINITHKLINTTQEGYNESINTIDTKIEFIDELIQFAEKQKISAITMQ